MENYTKRLELENIDLKEDNDRLLAENNRLKLERESDRFILDNIELVIQAKGIRKEVRAELDKVLAKRGGYLT